MTELRELVYEPFETHIEVVRIRIHDYAQGTTKVVNIANLLNDIDKSKQSVENIASWVIETEFAIQLIDQLMKDFRDMMS